MFDKSKTIETSGKPAKSGSTAPEITILGMFSYTAICTAIGALTSLKGVYEMKVKTAAVNHWVKEGMKLKRKPENIRAVEGVANGSVEMRNRASSSPLTPEDAQRLRDHNIPLDEVISQKGVWVIDPTIISDDEKMKQVVACLKDLSFAGDLFKWQEEKKVTIIDSTKDASLNAIFALQNEDVVRDLLSMSAVVAIKPTLETGDSIVVDAFTHVSKLTGGLANLANVVKGSKPESKAVERAVRVKGKDSEVAA